MEGFSESKEKLRPTDEPGKMESREEKMETAAKSITEQFNNGLAEISERIKMRPIFETERGF
jgi:hypothetical protein